MKILLAQSSGFCIGVENSIKVTTKTLEENDKVYSLGPPIHNMQVINKLENEGLVVIDDISDIYNNKLIIRSHGVPLSIYDKIEANGIELIDTTCPIVRKVQKKVNEHYHKGYSIIIIGDKNHPEVIGINGWCDNSAQIINSSEDILNLPLFNKVCVVAQTTMTKENFIKLTSLLEDKYKDNEILIFDTLCNITRSRQDACEKLSKKVDAMIVIGGYHSSNTQKLVQISKKNCKKTFHIETVHELNLNHFYGLDSIGITAGASTPDWIIKEVIDKIRQFDSKI